MQHLLHILKISVAKKHKKFYQYIGQFFSNAVFFKETNEERALSIYCLGKRPLYGKAYIF